MKKWTLVVLLVLLLIASGWLGWRLTKTGDDPMVHTISLPFGWGEVVLPLDKNLSTDTTSFQDAGKPLANFYNPVTEFLPEMGMRVDALVVSRGYGKDRIERALLRGVVRK